MDMLGEGSGVFCSCVSESIFVRRPSCLKFTCTSDVFSGYLFYGGGVVDDISLSAGSLEWTCFVLSTVAGCCSFFLAVQEFSVMGLDYGVHVLGAAIGNFQCCDSNTKI